MPLRVLCSAGHLMMVPDHRAGTVLRCPNCGIDVQVPGQAVGPAKALGQARLQSPPLARSAAAPAISGAGEQSPQVAGHSTGPKSGIGQAGKPRVKPPMLPAKAKKPAEVVPPPVVIAPEPARAIKPAATEPEIRWRDAPPATPAASKTPTTAADMVFAEVQTRAEKIEKKVATPPTRPATSEPSKKPAAGTTAPPKSRWQTEPAAPEPAQPKPAPPKAGGSSRPRSTLTGTMLAPDTSNEPPAEFVPQPKAAVESTLLANKKVGKKVAKEAPPPPIAAENRPEPKREPKTQLTPAPLPEPPPIIAEPEPQLSFHSAATQVEPYVPPPAAPPVVVVQGVRPTASQRIMVWQLAAALLAAAFLSIGPSLWEISDYLRSDGEQSVSRWAFLLLVLGIVQVGCVALLAQVPDWSSVWIVTLQSLGLSAIYAAVLGLTIITGGDSTLIEALELGFQYERGKVPMWCVCLAATYASLAFFAGRMSAKWRKMLKQMQASDEAAMAH